MADITIMSKRISKNKCRSNDKKVFKASNEEPKIRSINPHYNPSLRLLHIQKSMNRQTFGFHLTRSKWDPYPWISEIDRDSPAEYCGLKAGDCVLEVNGEDVLGLRICDISQLTKTQPDNVTLLLWNAGTVANCHPESLCCGPMPLNLKQLSAAMQAILAIIECPVCLETIAPPAMQCQNGHLLCVECRIKAEKCPVCRDRYSPCPSLIAEKIYNSVVDAFNLRDENKFQQKLFGSEKFIQPVMHPVVVSELQRSPEKKEENVRKKEQKLTKMKENKNELHKSIELISSCRPLQQAEADSPKFPTNLECKSEKNYTNQLLGIDNNSFISNSSTANMKPISKHFSISSSLSSLSMSSNDLLQKDRTNLITIERCPSMKYFSQSSSTGSERVSLMATLPKGTMLPAFFDKRPESTAIISTTTRSIERINNNRKTAIETTNGKNELSSPMCSPLAARMQVTDTDFKIDSTRAPPTPLTPLTSLPTPTHELQKIQQREKAFRCPCDCGNYYNESSLLYRHVKEDHRIPFLCYGSSSTDIPLPLQTPILGACILLAFDGTKNFWIRFKVDGRSNSIYVSALLEGTDVESSDFLIETRLTNRLDEKILLERELITRSIVHSLMTTTWDETFININDGNGICYNRESQENQIESDGLAPALNTRKSFNPDDGTDCELRLNVVKKSC